MNSHYGYAFNLAKKDRLELEEVLGFSLKNNIDFYFNPINCKIVIQKLKRLGFNKDYEQEYQNEKEVVYSKGKKQIFLYL